MTTIELGKKLRELYDTPGANKVAMIHLFGILYANELDHPGHNINEILKAADMYESYRSEITKGKRLARYVRLKDEYVGKF